MTLSGTRDTQEVLKTLDELDIEVDNADGPVSFKLLPSCRTRSFINDSAGRMTTTMTVSAIGKN